MTVADESEERIGFSQDLLQNLQKYRDFDTYKNNIVQFNEQKCHEKHKCVEVTSAMPPEIQESILRINPTPFSWDRFASKADFFVF